MAPVARFLSFESTPDPFVNFQHSLEMAHEYVNWRTGWQAVCPAARGVARFLLRITLLPPYGRGDSAKRVFKPVDPAIHHWSKSLQF
jgi:hypothetical protein